MARIRSIKPSFFRHEELYEAEMATGLPLRLAFAGLWTAADREGRFRWSARNLKLDCLPYDEIDFSRVLDALATRGFIVMYRAGDIDYGCIPTWKAHQIINNRESASVIPPPNEINVLTREPRVDDVTTTRLEQDQGEGKGMEGKGMDSPTRKDASLVDDDQFEQFWKDFPKRDGANPRAPAEKKYRALCKSGVDPAVINASAKQCADFYRGKGQIGTPYVPQAMTWLNQQRFTDYAAEAYLANEAEARAATKVHIKSETPQWHAWEQHLGKKLPVDRNFGWLVDSEWPPGTDEPVKAKAPPRVVVNSNQAAAE